MHENDCIQWVLILFLVIFNASLSGSDDFVLFDSLHGNCAYLKMFNVIHFAHKCATLNGNPAIEVYLCVLDGGR